ncbi:hypothetical protein ACIQXQ_20185 [Peribacillus sp. NPDC097198]|uniref:hypothetical protein n=1 Tax=Peribacillus sp. NPDC097198 TaxID=3364397 RepID=UPI00381DBEBE
MFKKHKIEVIPYKDFMSRPATSIQRKTPLHSNIYSFFPSITITSFFPIGDPAFAFFLVSGGLIAVVALSETALASSGLSSVSSVLSSLFRFVLPVVGYGLIFWFLFQI